MQRFKWKNTINKLHSVYLTRAILNTLFHINSVLSKNFYFIFSYSSPKLCGHTSKLSIEWYRLNTHFVIFNAHFKSKHLSNMINGGQIMNSTVFVTKRNAESIHFVFLYCCNIFFPPDNKLTMHTDRITSFI